QNAVPLLTNSSIFAGPNPLAAANPFGTSDPRFAQQAIVSGLLNEPGNPTVPCLNVPNPDPVLPPTVVPMSAQDCAFALGTALTVSPVTGLSAGQTLLNEYLIGQFETN